MIDKSQALNQFWSQFGLIAYDENSVPDDAKMPYITYETTTDSIGYDCFLTASINYKSSNWMSVSLKAEEASKALTPFYRQDINGGAMWMTKGHPFAKRMTDPDDKTIKRIILNVNVEYLTEY